MTSYQVIATFVWTHKFTQKQVDDGTEIPHKTIVKKINQLLKEKDYNIEEEEI